MRKIFTFLAVVALIACLCVAFVACNNDDGGGDSGDKGVLLHPDMTVDQIKDVLKDITSYTLVRSENGTFCGKDIYTVDGHYYTSSRTEGIIFETTMFYEDNRYYCLSSTIETYEGGTQRNSYEIVDLNGVEFEKKKYVAQSTLNNSILRWFDDKENTYSIKDDTITFERYDKMIRRNISVVLKDINKSVLEMPDVYKDNYKFLEANRIAFESNNTADTRCTITSMSFPAASVTIPETLNGKIVDELQIDNMFPDEIILPTTIEKISVADNAAYNKYNINYLGTREQWNALEKDITEYCIVKCIDDKE